jgi:hypothetical protein
LKAVATTKLIENAQVRFKEVEKRPIRDQVKEFQVEEFQA